MPGGMYKIVSQFHIVGSLKGNWAHGPIYRRPSPSYRFNRPCQCTCSRPKKELIFVFQFYLGWILMILWKTNTTALAVHIRSWLSQPLLDRLSRFILYHTSQWQGAGTCRLIPNALFSLPYLVRVKSVGLHMGGSILSLFIFPDSSFN